jgi:glycosyltransferase 2 family protein
MSNGISRGAAARIAIVSGILISIVFLWLAVRNIDFAEVAAAFRDARLGYAIPMLGALVGFYWLRAARWRNLLAPATASKLKASALLPSMMVGVAANNILPAHLGELVRVYLFSRDYPVPKTTVLVTLILERFLDVVTLLVLLLAVLVAGDVGSELKVAMLVLSGAALAIAAGASAVLVFRPACARLARAVLRHLPARVATYVEGMTEHALQGLAILRSSHMYGRLAVNSLAQWILMASCVWFALLAVGIDAPIHISLYILGLVVIGLALPASPGFVGTIQFCFVLGLRSTDVSPSLAFSASLVYHAITWLGPTLWGAWFVRTYNLKWRNLKAVATEAQ